MLTNLPLEGDFSPSSIFSFFAPLSRRLIGDLLLLLPLDPLLLPLLLLDEDFELLFDPLPQQNVQQQQQAMKAAAIATYTDISIAWHAGLHK